jgi:CubicO group peptidase (beta-lactamase class C family)
MKSSSASPWPIVVVLLALCLPLPVAADEAAGLETRVDELYDTLRRSDAPGGVVAVIRDGEVVHRTAFGMADLERGVAVTPDSVFEIGSISKQFTAMCILLLELDGKLALDDDVREYVPELPAYERPITLRHLLHHTSGIRDIETLIPLAGLPWFNYSSRRELLELITRQRGLNFPPGRQYLYSNSGYLLLAEIVERVSGESLRDFAETRIFGPLGMNDTEFWDHPSQIVEDRAIAYSETGEGSWSNELWYLPFDGPAGVYTSVGDLARWDANFYDNRLGGGAALIERMETPGTLENGDTIDYAAGLRVREHRGQFVISHGGAWMGYRASLMRFPELHLTVVALSNSARGLGSMRVADLYLDEMLGAEPSEPEAAPYEPPVTRALAAEELGRYEGVYWNESQGLLRRIDIREGTLHYVRGPESSSQLGALGDGRFAMIGPTVRVDVEFDVGSEARGASPVATGMTVEVDGQEPLSFERVQPASEAMRTELAGDYWSPELERELGLSVEDGRIQVSWADEQESHPAEAIGGEELLIREFVPVPWYPQDVRLRVERDARGVVRGLTLSCDMVRGIRFEKREG